MEQESKTLFDRQKGYWFRGIAVVMVIASHYAEWWTWFFATEGKAEDFRMTLSKLGVYGVNIFFFFSGYGLTKAAERKEIDGSFISRRIQSVYIPYLVVVGIIQILSGGFDSFSGFIRFLYGNDYWFMVVIFLFYIGFILIWQALKNPHLRGLVFLLYTFAVIQVLYDKNMQSFWYVSNLAFALGITMATYETDCRRVPLIARILLIPLLLAFTIYYELYMDKSGMNPEQILRLQMINTVLWTTQIACIASLIPWHDPVFTALGKRSLYLYLVHTFVFMKCVNALHCSILLRYVIAVVATVITAVLCELLTNGLIKLISDRRKL